MGQINLKSQILENRIPLRINESYYFSVDSNLNNEILMNVLNATEFYNFTTREIRIFSKQNNNLVLKNIFKCDKFYWYNSNFTELRYDYILQEGDVIYFTAVANSDISIPGAGINYSLIGTFNNLDFELLGKSDSTDYELEGLFNTINTNIGFNKLNFKKFNTIKISPGGQGSIRGM